MCLKANYLMFSDGSYVLLACVSMLVSLFFPAPNSLPRACIARECAMVQPISFSVVSWCLLCLWYNNAWLHRVCEISGPHRGVICCCGKELAGNKVAVHHAALQGLCHECGDTSASMTTLGIRSSSAHIPVCVCVCAPRNAVKCSGN